jgi:hypothetical protein
MVHALMAAALWEFRSVDRVDYDSAIKAVHSHHLGRWSMYFRN